MVTSQSRNCRSIVPFCLVCLWVLTLMTTRTLYFHLYFCETCGLKTCNRTDLACLASHAAVATPASTARAVTLCILDEHYVDNFLNFAESAERAAVHNLLPTTITEAAYVALQNLGIASYFSPFINESSETRESKFKTKAFNLKGGMKSQTALPLLRLGYSVLVLDLDTFIIRDPFPYMNCTDCDFEVATTRDTTFGRNMCIGVIFFRPTVNMMEMLSTQIRRLYHDPTQWDQFLFTTIAYEYRRKGKIKYNFLSFTLFPNGHDFKFLNRDIFRFDAYKEVAIVHNNMAMEITRKQYRAKETGTWILDKNGYYSDPSAKYLTYHNPLAGYEKKEVASLFTAVAIAKSLGRILILPQFHCTKKREKVQVKCSLEHVMNINAFHKKTGFTRYRENYFLRHFKVPKEVLASTTAPILFLTREIEAMELPLHSVVAFRHPDGRAPTLEDINVWLKPYRNKSIIRLHSLYFSLNWKKSPN